MTDPASARLTIDLDALAANFRMLQGRAGAAEVAPVVKADAYGLGAGPVARRLWAEGARTFFVARLAEGEALRALLGVDRLAKIYVLDGAPAGTSHRLAQAELTPVLNSLEQAQGYAGRGPVALHVDTGMNRLGLRQEELDAPALRRLEIELVMSHLSCASTPDSPKNRLQAERFARVRHRFANARASLANSGGVFLGDDYRCDVVRPGIALYGGGPFEGPHPEISAVATHEAPILQLRKVLAGETVGYGAAWTAERPTRVAIVAAGYADGLLRASSPGGAVWLDGALRPIRGRISMDLIAIDLGDSAAGPGDFAELFGPNRKIDEAARAADSLAYELLVRAGPRSTRTYLGRTD